MHWFPDRLSVRLFDEKGSTRRQEGILLCAGLSAAGRAYYWVMLPLSDANGHTSITREEIERSYKENQELFLMDYKLRLEELDRTVTIDVLSQEEIEKRIPTLLGIPWINDETIGVYRSANNGSIRPKRVTFNVLEPHPDDLVVDVVLEGTRQEGRSGEKSGGYSLMLLGQCLFGAFAGALVLSLIALFPAGLAALFDGPLPFPLMRLFLGYFAGAGLAGLLVFGLFPLTGSVLGTTAVGVLVGAVLYSTVGWFTGFGWVMPELLVHSTIIGAGGALYLRWLLLKESQATTMGGE